MLIFANPQYLYLLFLIPIFYICLYVYIRRRKKVLEQFADSALMDRLMPHYSTAKLYLRLVLYSFAFVFLVLSLSRPQMGAKIKQKKSKGAEVMIVLDVSNSMLAEDYSPNRLERGKLAISKLVDKLHNDRIGLIIFAGSPFVQLPITTDYVSAKFFLNNISTNSIANQGTNIEDALSLAMKSFTQESENSRAIILITDGENHTGDPVKLAEIAKEKGIRIYTIGVGSKEGKAILSNGEYIRDEAGDIVVSKLDETVLIDIAKASGGAYVQATNENFGLSPIIDQIRSMEEKDFYSVSFEEYDEQYMSFLIFALMFFVVELLVGKRKIFKN